MKVRLESMSRHNKGIWGFVVVVLFVASSVFFNEAVQALNKAPGLYGYYNNSYGYSATLSSSDKPPSAPASVTCTAGSTNNVATCTFTAVTTTTDSTSLDNFSSYHFVRGTATGLTTSSTSADSMTSGLSTQGSGTQSFTLTGLVCGTAHFIGVYVSDTVLNTSSVTEATVTTSACSAGAGSGGGGGGGTSTGTGGTSTGTGTTAPSTTTPAPTTAPSAPAATNQQAAPSAPSTGRSAQTESAAASAVAKSGLSGSPSAAAIRTAVAYGLGGANYGTGENAAVIREYIEQFKLKSKELKDECEWKDINRLMHGVGPVCNKPANKEWQEAVVAFKKLYKRGAGSCSGGVTDEFDRRALNFWGTGARHPRKLADEASAIKIFAAAYKHVPDSALDWRGVKAIAYSGASRECPSQETQRARVQAIPGLQLADTVREWTAALLSR